MFYIDRSGFLSPSPRIETSSSSSPSPSPLPFPRLTLLTLARLDRQTERSDRVTSFFLFDGFQAPPLLAPHSPFALRERVRDADKETGEAGTDREREEKKTPCRLSLPVRQFQGALGLLVCIFITRHKREIRTWRHARILNESSN